MKKAMAILFISLMFLLTGCLTVYTAPPLSTPLYPPNWLLGIWVSETGDDNIWEIEPDNLINRVSGTVYDYREDYKDTFNAFTEVENSGTAYEFIVNTDPPATLTFQRSGLKSFLFTYERENGEMTEKYIKK